MCFGRSDRGDDAKRCEQEKQLGGGREGRGLSEHLEQANIDGIVLYCTSTSVVPAT